MSFELRLIATLRRMRGAKCGKSELSVSVLIFEKGFDGLVAEHLVGTLQQCGREAFKLRNVL